MVGVLFMLILEVVKLHGFDGWILKVNGVEFPTSLIKAETYKITPDQETDIDDFTDNDGIFHRNILPAKATKIEFETPPLRLEKMMEVARIILEDDDKLSLEYWNPKRFRYQSGIGYVPDISYEMNIVYRREKDILYHPVRIAFIEYGEV